MSTKSEKYFKSANIFLQTSLFALTTALFCRQNLMKLLCPLSDSSVDESPMAMQHRLARVTDTLILKKRQHSFTRLFHINMTKIGLEYECIDSFCAVVRINCSLVTPSE